MDCRTSSEIMIKWMDGPLADQEEKQLASHMEHCPDCRREYAEWHELARALAHLPEPTPSTGFETRVMAAIDPALYAAPGPLSPKAKTGRLLVWLGILGFISIAWVELVERLQRVVLGWLLETSTYQVMIMVYERVVIRGILNFVMPQKSLLDWIVRVEATGHWWYMLGTFNLVMLLVLIKVSLDRVLAGERGEVQ